MGFKIRINLNKGNIPKFKLAKSIFTLKDSTSAAWIFFFQNIELKFMFSKKATKIDEIFTIDLTVTVKFGNKECFDEELIGIKEPFPVNNLPFTSYE